MIIGIDLDNTIINYGNAFLRTALSFGLVTKDWVEKRIPEFHKNTLQNYNKPKEVIRDFLRSLEGGEEKWQYLQGQVYGKNIHYAELFPGVANFLLHCRQRQVIVYIISHKTEYGHHDKNRISLRESAIKYLDQCGILSNKYGINRNSIFFSNTRKDKVLKIKQLECDFFIDDLPEVFYEKHFPSNTTKILFSDVSDNRTDLVFNSWYRINNYFFHEISETDIVLYTEKATGQNVNKATQIKGRGNSRIFYIELSSNNHYAGKVYPDPTIDNRPRRKTEFNAYKFINKYRKKIVPMVYKEDEYLNFALYEWLSGSAVRNPSLEDVNQALYFISLLKDLSSKNDAKSFNPASAACFSGRDIEAQIYDRYNSLHRLSEQYPILKNFLENKFYPAFQTALDLSKKRWPDSFDKKLTKSFQILSPSDFGFHNAIKTNSGLRFIDFEYFGWDDPAKLTSDFLLHPGMKLSKEIKKHWANGMMDLFSDDAEFQERVCLSFALYGFCWCLILLNEFRADDLERRKFADIKESNTKHKQMKQLRKAQDFLEFNCKLGKHGLPYE